MEHVRDVKEESITDFMAWQWSEVDNHFHYMSMRTFTHHEESTISGADFDLEFWLVGQARHVCFAVQAKKFIKQHDSYVNRLNYPNHSKKQLNTLLKYAELKGKVPYYFIYSVPEKSSNPICNTLYAERGGIFVMDARIIEEFADGKYGRRISRDDLLAACHPFHCLFCCRIECGSRYAAARSSPLNSSWRTHPNSDLPGYVTHLLDKGAREDSLATEQGSTSVPSKFNGVGVYDMRDVSPLYNNWKF